MSDLLKIGLPLVFGIATAILGFYLGRRGKHDDIEIKKRHELAAELSIVFQEAVSLYEALNTSYMANFRHSSPDEIADSFDRLAMLHEGDVKLMEELSSKRDRLTDLIRSGRLYLNSAILDKMAEYVKTGDFTYTTDGGVFVNTYVRDFFTNLRDDKHMRRRETLSQEIIKDMKRLLH